MKTWCRPDTAGHSSCTGAFLNSTVICAIALLNPYRYAISKVSIAHALNEIHGLAMIGPVLAGSQRDDSASRAAVLQNCVTYSTQVPCAVRSTQSRIPHRTRRGVDETRGHSCWPIAVSDRIGSWHVSILRRQKNLQTRERRAEFQMPCRDILEPLSLLRCMHRDCTATLVNTATVLQVAFGTHGVSMHDDYCRLACSLLRYRCAC